MIRDKVQYVPAGLEAWPGRTGQIFVRLERNEKTSIKKGAGYKEIRLRDRTLYVIYDSTKQRRLVDSQLDCDYMVPYQNPAELAGRTELVLVNPVHAKNFHNVFRPHGIKIISDSGGFQMLRGVTDFVHPDDPIAFYNKHTDIGIPLDLPMKAAYEPMFFDAATKMMKANDAYMLPRLHKGKVLSVVSHGSNVENRKRRLDAVFRPSPVVSIAGLHSSVADDDLHKNLTALVNAMYVISQTRDTTEYYHFLGVTSRFWFIIYAILVGTGYVKSCGGDSVSHRLNAIIGSYKHQLSYDGGRPLNIEKLSHRSVCTSCTCPICQAVGDLNILADFQIAESHQIWYSEQEKDMICDSVQTYLDGHLTLKDLAEQWLARGQYDVLAFAVDYIDSVIAKGFNERLITKKKALFDNVSKPELDPTVVDHYKRVLTNYETFHKKKFLK